jgi:basic membrane protein A and related proteins
VTRLLLVTVVAALLAAPAADTGARKLRVGYITSAGAATDDGIGERVYKGFVRAVRELGVDGHVLVVSPGHAPDSVLAAFGRQRYDLVIAGAFVAKAPVERAARTFPGSRFFYAGGPASIFSRQLKNIRGLVIHVEEAGYLAGYLAALMETQRSGKRVVAAVGGIPQVPDVANYIRGYRAGARRADPAVTVLAGYSQDFSNPSKCHSVALQQIAAGAGVVFQVAGQCGLGALKAAKERHVWGIGVDVDQSALGPHVLTSALSKPEVSIYLAIRDLKNRTFKARSDVVLTLRNGGVGLGKISPKVPSSFLRRLDTIRRRIRTGRITVPRVPG